MGPCVSKVRPFPDDHVNAIPKHVCGTPNINKNIGSAMLNLLDQLSKHHFMGKPHKFLAPLSNWFHTWSLVIYIMLCLSLGKIYSYT